MISVVIPLYNKETSIAQSLRSVLQQESSDFEVVIVDDGSTDNSVSVVEAIQDSRIRLIRQGNGGPSKARNTGVKNAKGEWILFLDADDELLQGALKHFATLVSEHPEVSFFGCSSVINDGKDKKKQPFKFKEGLLKNSYKAQFFSFYCPRTGNSLFRHELLRNNLFDERIRRFEDLEFFLRIFGTSQLYLSPVSVLQENRTYAEASHARKNIKEDFLGYLDFKGKSFWEKMVLYRFFLEERGYYPEQSYQLYSGLYKRYDLLLVYKFIMKIKKIYSYYE